MAPDDRHDHGAGEAAACAPTGPRPSLSQESDSSRISRRGQHELGVDLPRHLRIVGAFTELMPRPDDTLTTGQPVHVSDDATAPIAGIIRVGQAAYHVRNRLPHHPEESLEDVGPVIVQPARRDAAGGRQSGKPAVCGSSLRGIGG
jgi:hypothetical protein